ncbi:hypothetical protein SEA_JUMBO_51 [Gordonia phage Jumbo]|uniref:Uncharacterized protein n=1 Tax=Gordonia phage Jumbo TaxID=1887650 RepID=A0A1B3B0P4_9CAUD|nr:hypothetical protein BIZ69_gp051 [Gordonia phage Jumbo]AOE44561.1 hypothetical protein SEA_JUMBO_51 [Gordonia phage Jumbo]
MSDEPIKFLVEVTYTPGISKGYYPENVKTPREAVIYDLESEYSDFFQILDGADSLTVIEIGGEKYVEPPQE